MANRIAPGLLAAGMLLGLPAPLVAQQSAGPPRAWRVEVLGGVRRLAPEDLNAQVEYDTTVVDYLRGAQIQQQHEGGLLGLTRGQPFAVRVVRRLGPRWSVGAGWSRLSRERRSSAGASYRFTEIDPRAQEYRREFAQTVGVEPLVLAVRENLPHGLIRYDMPVARRLRVGASLSAGWLVADAEMARTQTTQGGYYPNSREIEVRMTGRGGGLAGDVSLSAHLSLTSRLGLLFEGGYGWRRAPEVTGHAATTVRVQDGEAAEVELEQVTEREGRWVNQPVRVQTSSESWRGTVPAIGTEGTPFTLNLSGWQVGIGVSVGF